MKVYGVCCQSGQASGLIQFQPMGSPTGKGYTQVTVSNKSTSCEVVNVKASFTK